MRKALVQAVFIALISALGATSSLGEVDVKKGDGQRFGSPDLQDQNLPPHIEKELRDWLSQNTKQLENGPLAPPWVQFSDYPRRTIGWRMGPGEQYLQDYVKWFASLDADSRLKYINFNPEPLDWMGFYESIPLILRRD